MRIITIDNQNYIIIFPYKIYRNYWTTNFNKFIVIKDTKNGPLLAWVKIGISDLSNVEVIEGLNTGETVYILPSKSLVDYQRQFRERVEASFSFG